MSTHSKGDPPVARHGIPLKRYLTWNPDVFQAKKIGSLRLHVPSDMKNSIILNDYMIQQQQETLL